MNRHLNSIALTCLAIIVCMIACGSKRSHNSLSSSNMKYENHEGDYEKEWKEIDSLDQKRLPKSAYEKVKALYLKAKKDNNHDQVIKTILYQGKYINQLEEDGQNKPLEFLLAEKDKSTSPTKEILMSIAAEVYSQYANRNFYELRDRTDTKDFEPKDISTWSLEKLYSKAAELYLASVANESLKNIKVNDFSAILSDKNELFDADKYRPTLYDILAHRAIQYLKRSRHNMTNPIEDFHITQAEAFAPTKEFIHFKFANKNLEDYDYQTLLLFQQILAFHKEKGNKIALADVDIERIKYVKNKSIHTNKNKLYEDALSKMKKAYQGQEAEAEILYLQAKNLKKKGDNYSSTSPAELQWAYKEVVELCETAIKKHPKSYGASLCGNMKADMTRKDIDIQVEKVVTSDTAFPFRVSYKNNHKLWYRIIKVSKEDLDKLDDLGNAGIKEKLIGFPTLRQGKIDLPKIGDYRQHSLEYKVDGLPYGSYILMTHTREDFKLGKSALSWVSFCVSDLAYYTTTDKENNKATVYVVNRKTGQPEANVEVKIFEEVYDYNKRKHKRTIRCIENTDANGKIQCDFQKRRVAVALNKGKDAQDLDGYNYFYQTNKENEDIKRTTSHFFLDRAIYRPGQTIYFKTLFIQTDRNGQGMPSIYAHKNVSIIFMDNNWQEVKKMKLQTNEFGSVSGKFQAPMNGSLGRMHLIAKLEGITHNVGSHDFRVEEYKRPKFEVTFEPIKQSYQLNEDVTVKGLAKAFAGNKIDNATVKYRVVREARYPYWYRWWLPTPSSPSKEITFGETKTNEKGEFEVQFSAIPDPSIAKSSEPIFTYRVYADVVDMTGETRSNETTVQVGYNALDISINVPKQVNKADFPAFSVTSKNLNGEFEATKGNISIYKLENPRTFVNRYWETPDQFVMTKEEYKRAFPLRPYKDEQYSANWKTSKQVATIPFDTQSSKEVQLDKNKYPVGTYKLVLKTKDKYGKALELERIFTVFSPEEKQVEEAFFHYIKKKEYEVGETATILVGSAYKDAKVLFRVEHDGKLIQEKWINLNGVQSLDIPIREAYRGGIAYYLDFVYNNRKESTTVSLYIPWSNKDLQVEYLTFRDKLYPGQKEEWQIKISGAKKEKVTAEMVAAMYDASLDEFAKNHWAMRLYPYRTANYALNANFFRAENARVYNVNWRDNYNRVYFSKTYRDFKWFGFSIAPRILQYGGHKKMMRSMEIGAAPTSAAPPPPKPTIEEVPDEAAYRGAANDKAEVNTFSSFDTETYKEEELEKTTNFDNVKVRTNLDETVFFFPNLGTDKDGNIYIKFTMNEALTKWKFLGMAHTKQLEYTFMEKEVITQKDLMVMPNAPRFFREGDKIIFTAKVSNLTQKTMKGEAILKLFDAVTNEPIDAILGNTNNTQSFSAPAEQSALLQWTLNIPKGKVNAVKYQVIAKSGTFSDGEENAVPVLTNRMMVTETLPLPIRAEQTRTFTLDKLKNSGNSSSLQHHQVTLEFTSNPAWYAVQALPYLMEYPYKCTEQIFSRYYANSLATNVTKSHPNIKKVFDSWKNTDALESNLSKNQELKYALLEDTPWVLDAQNEAEQKRNIALLFDLNKMAKEQDKALKTLVERQTPNGGFAWFPGGRDSWYITQYLVEGFGHLDKLGVKSIQEQQVEKLIQNAIGYCDDRLVEMYGELEKRVQEGQTKFEDDHLNNMAIHYLYTRSFFSFDMNKKTIKVANYYKGQALKYWTQKGLYQQGMLALALDRMREEATAQDIVKSLRERSLNHDELGMYWKYDTGYFWYQLPIETHSLMIEVFDQVAKDEKAVDELKVWLLKNKQTSDWKTTKGTAAAVYALLMTGDNWLKESQDVNITMGGKKVAIPQDKQAGTGYFKIKYDKEEITPNMATVQVQNPNKVVAWGAMYWQYLEDLDKITTFEETPLQIKKQLFVEENTQAGPVIQPIDKTTLKVGDKVKVRIEIRVDRDMEYVHMKDMRASGFEPINVLSQYKWQGGLGYYESTRDASTNFFFSHLPKGTYVFEYPLRVQHQGDFSNGVTTIQCMYAPEFTSHSEGVRVEVKE